MTISLRDQRRVLIGGQEQGALYLGGQKVWSRPDPFPASLFGSAPYVHYAAEDAGGATWTARHGLPLSLDRVGAPIVRSGWLDCTMGCYWVAREPWPRTMALSLWMIVGAARPDAPLAYNGGAQSGGGNSDLAFYRDSRLTVGGSGRYAVAYFTDWTASPAARESLEWTKPEGQIAGSSVEFYQNITKRSVSRRGSYDRTLTSDGPVFVVGGARDAASQTIYGGMAIRDVILTIGWTLTPEHRAALETYRKRRVQ